MEPSFLKKLGFSEKSSIIYLTLLRLGPSSVRALAAGSGLNRGVVYEGLKWLQEKGLVSFYQKTNKQFFVAEDPEKLNEVLSAERSELEAAAEQLKGQIPELKSLHHKGGERPVARYIEKNELHTILEDVLETCEEQAEPVYRIYSTAGIREYLYASFPTFSDVRIARGIAVKVVAIGDGGELRGLDERKWLKVKSPTPTYIIIYPGKTAYISLNAKGEPVGVLVENIGVYETQKIIFDALWEKL